MGSGAGSARFEPKPNESAKDGRVGFEIDRRRHGGDPHLGITDSILGSTAKCLTPVVRPQISLTVRANLTASQCNQWIKAVCVISSIDRALTSYLLVYTGLRRASYI